MNAIDAISSELADRGWSLGDLAYRQGEWMSWQVFGHSGEQHVLARGPTQTVAWTMAATQIVKIRMSLFLDRLVAIQHELQGTRAAACDDRSLLEESDTMEFELGRDHLFRRNWLDRARE